MKYNFHSLYRVTLNTYWQHSFWSKDFFSQNILMFTGRPKRFCPLIDLYYLQYWKYATSNEQKTFFKQLLQQNSLFLSVSQSIRQKFHATFGWFPCPYERKFTTLASFPFEAYQFTFIYNFRLIIWTLLSTILR